MVWGSDERVASPMSDAAALSTANVEWGAWLMRLLLDCVVPQAAQELSARQALVGGVPRAAPVPGVGFPLPTASSSQSRGNLPLLRLGSRSSTLPVASPERVSASVLRDVHRTALSPGVFGALLG